MLFVQVVAEANHSSSASVMEDEALRTTGLEDGPSTQSGDSRALSSRSLPSLTQPDKSQPLPGLTKSTLADDVPGLQLLTNSQTDLVAELTPPLVGPGVLNTNTGFGRTDVLPISGNGNVSDSNLLAAMEGNWHLNPSQNSSQHSSHTEGSKTK